MQRLPATHTGNPGQQGDQQGSQNSCVLSTAYLQQCSSTRVTQLLAHIMHRIDASCEQLHQAHTTLPLAANTLHPQPRRINQCLCVSAQTVPAMLTTPRPTYHAVLALLHNQQVPLYNQLFSIHHAGASSCRRPQTQPGTRAGQAQSVPPAQLPTSAAGCQVQGQCTMLSSAS